jgi:hypothetical protein
MPTVLSTTTPKARKRHICDSCCKPILPGTVYERQFCADGGDAWSYVAHRSCIAAAQILWDNDIRGDEDALINVSDMDAEDRGMVYKSSPEIYHSVWPDAPAPGTPKLTSS